ncbi:unnamed protein product [Phytophthora fragariaefolia]|uniref:Unnamed protein product n=1 Tax=Phytophthora fragariaefolia TaxID=1490495 RepID=A0A9W7DB15_9STRA|nr:unnamed protein product [Phytophthora fragariaefolia]
MGVMKKAPLLGSSASAGENGQSMIEGDRNLLSHYGDSVDRQTGGLAVSTRKSAALRRNLVARGLARQYGDQKAREENFKTQVPRHQLQQKILDNYQRHQAHRKTSEGNLAELREDGDIANEFDENVVLVVPRRMNSAPLKSSSRYKRHMSPVVPPKGATSFLRNVSMRQLRDNQDTTNDEMPGPDKDVVYSNIKDYPSESDFPHARLQHISRSSSNTIQQDQPSKAAVQSLKSNFSAPWISRTHRSSQIVLRELGITKDIMMREQLVRQLKQATPLIGTLAQDLLKAQDDHKQSLVALESAKSMSPSRVKKTGSLIGLTVSTPTQAESDKAVTDAEATVIESKTRLAELIKRMKHHVHHAELLVTGLQQTTLSIVEGILDWRQMRQRRRQISNFQRLFRFQWKRQRIPNYLLHVDDDLRELFPSVALELIIGPKALYNPLLLPRVTLQLLGTSSAGKTFLTEKDCSGVSGFARTSPGRKRKHCISSIGLKRLQEALGIVNKSPKSSPVKPIEPASDLDRLRQCIEAIYAESNLEALERQRCGEEEQRAQATYDPFSTIKSAGGVEETLRNMMALQAPNAQLLGEQLRIRQEDTTRAAASVPGNEFSPSDASAEALQINPERLRGFFEKRAALLDPEAECEVRDIQRWGQKNKLQGKIMVRKNNEKRVEHLLARKIQLQYLAHRHRNQLQHNVTRFLRNVRTSVVNIQRIFRGYRAKSDYRSIRSAWLEHKRRAAAVRIIVNAFRRYRRRLRHRRSMTVESVAQAQLMNLLANKMNDSVDSQNAAERYRRVGEERRRQRVVLLQKHKMEQQEMERKRNIAAVRMQAVVRAHLAQAQAKLLRQEKKAHLTAVSAMAIQSKIRKFLNVQQERRQRFRKDLERVNQSAVRIQSIYRGYNSRASQLLQMDEKTQRTLDISFVASSLNEQGSDDDDNDDEEEGEDATDDDEEATHADVGKTTAVATHSRATDTFYEARLPPIVTSSSRPSSGSGKALVPSENQPSQAQTPPNSVSLPPIWMRDGSSSSLMSSTSSSGTGRRISMGMMRIELKLREAELGDNFETPPSRRNSFVGNMRHQT